MSLSAFLQLLIGYHHMCIMTKLWQCTSQTVNHKPIFSHIFSDWFNTRLNIRFDQSAGSSHRFTKTGLKTQARMQKHHYLILYRERCSNKLFEAEVQELWLPKCINFYCFSLLLFLVVSGQDGLIENARRGRCGSYERDPPVLVSINSRASVIRTPVINLTSSVPAGCRSSSPSLSSNPSLGIWHLS